MKKLLIALLILSLSLSLFSCNSVKEPQPTGTSEKHTENAPKEQIITVLEADGEHSFSEVTHKSEIELKSSSYIDDSKTDSQKTFTFLNNDYTLSYSETRTDYLYGESMIVYSYSSGGKFVEIGADPETDRIIMFIGSSINYYETVDKNQLKTESECLDIAKDYLKEFTNESDAYVLLYETHSGKTESAAIHSFTFSRKINDLETYDSVLISLTAYGDLLGIRFRSFESMKDATVITSDQLKKVDAAINEKIENIYKDQKSTYNISHKYDNILYLRLADGKYVLEYDVSVTLTQKDSENICYDRARLIVYID